jgi:ubiquinone/menaquinone biosynthesis C-methylase UbiE
MYDRMLGKAERAGLGEHRRALLAGATGDVLEIGGGTGANLEYYGDGVRTLTLVEPEKPMLKRLERHIGQRAPEAKALRAPAEDLPFNDASFDVAVSTLVLCTVDDVPRALRELRRVLRPRGRLLFIEHVRSDDPALARRQDRMLPINVRVGHGCHCNRRTLDSIRDAGFEITSLERDTLKHTPKFIQPLIVGVGTRRDRQAEAAAGTSETSSEQLETPTLLVDREHPGLTTSR